MNIIKIPPTGVVGMNLTEDLILNLDSVVFISTVTKTKFDNSKSTHTFLQLSCGSQLELYPSAAAEILATLKSSKKNEGKRGNTI